METQAASVTLGKKEREFLQDEIRRARQCRSDQGNYTAKHWQQSQEARAAQSCLTDRAGGHGRAEAMHGLADPVEAERIRAARDAEERRRLTSMGVLGCAWPEVRCLPKSTAAGSGQRQSTTFGLISMPLSLTRAFTPMPDIQQLIASEIAKTGYVLEHEIAQALKLKGWTVISGKYYVDDNEDTPREMDLIAYRVTRFASEAVEMYTVLIISCKKSDDNVWALLARHANLRDPNTDYWPLHAWSNDPAVTYQLARPGKAKLYHEGLRTLGVVDALSDPQVEVFAFQEMSKVSGAPKNDKAIFNAMTSLVKAQAYELSSLANRKRTRAVYQFNLISVLDSEMYRLLFATKGTGIKSSKIESEHYIARYIVSKRESFSRIRFITSQAFASTLDDYSRLHAANVNWFSTEQSEFYREIMKDPDRVQALSKQFYAKIKLAVKWRVESSFKTIKNFDEEPFLFWAEKTGQVEISYFETEGVAEWMNESSDIKKIFKDALESIYAYSGPFKFTGIPF